MPEVRALTEAAPTPEKQLFSSVIKPYRILYGDLGQASIK
jgi:hypothetical protein